MKTGKKPYVRPVLESFGAVRNFTTGGSGSTSEWSYETSSGMSAGSSGGGANECVKQNNSMMRNTQMC